MSNILKNISREFQKGSMLHKLIYINISIFLAFSILEVIAFMFLTDMSQTISKLYLPADNITLISRPWTILTYMFLHNNFLHLFFNMIWLHFGGKLFLQYLTPKQLLSTYIIGGISGGLLFIIAYNYLPALTIYTSNAQALGASASVLAIIIAISTHSPNYNISVPFIGAIKLKHIAWLCIILDILSIPKGNAGGHIAHLGGAMFGYFYINQLKQGTDFSIDFMKYINKLIRIFKQKNNLKKVYTRAKTDKEFNTEAAKEQKAINSILDKISNSGYESLNKEEKEKLFRASKK